MATPKIQKFIPMPSGSTEARVKALEEYVNRLSTELTYLLSHLDERNFTEEVTRKIKSISNDSKEA
jgi:RNase H-fold protein (predicted Holliday junction resolvase)